MYSHLRSRPLTSGINNRVKPMTKVPEMFIVGGSFWSRFKSLFKKIAGNKLVQQGVRTIVDKALTAAPALVDKGLTKLNPQLQKLESKIPFDAFSGVSKTFGDLAKQGSEKLLQIAKSEADKRLGAITEGSGSRKPNFRTKATMLNSAVFR